MENLVRIIGLAPSEISKEELLQRLRREHQRISDGLSRRETYKGRTRKRLASPSSALSPTKFLKMLKERGLTLEDYERLCKLEEKKK